MTTNAPTTTDTTIILDNGGGITLQIRQSTGNVGRNYQHTYWDATQAANDIKASMQPGCDISDWDGNEIDDGWLEPTDDEQSNGGYRIYTIADFLATDADDIWGIAGQHLRRMTWPTIRASDIIAKHGKELDHAPWGHDMTLAAMLQAEPDTVWSIIGSERKSTTYATKYIGDAAPVILTVYDAVEPQLMTEASAEAYLSATEIILVD